MRVARNAILWYHFYHTYTTVFFFQLKTLKAVVRDLRRQCAKLKKSQVSEAIQDLPVPQQHAVMACLAAAKRKGPKGNRFLLDWIYECLLMRIKSPKLYEHIRERKILVLPSRTTLNRYMRKLHPGYGYQPQLFQVLKQKISDFSEGAKHGKCCKIIHQKNVNKQIMTYLIQMFMFHRNNNG